MAKALNPDTGLEEEDGVEVPGRPGSVTSVPTIGTPYGTPSGQPDNRFDTGSPFFGSTKVKPIEPPALAPEAPPVAAPTTPEADPVQTVINQQAQTIQGGSPAAQTAAASQTTSPTDIRGLTNTKLAELLSRSMTPSIDDPDIAGALAANRLAESRGMNRDRHMLAERSAAEGTNNAGGFDSRLLGLGENRAQREGQFAGDLFHDASRERIQELTSVLALAGNQLSEQDRNALSLEIARMQAQIAGDNRGENARQFDISSSQRLGEFNATQNSTALQQLLALIGGG